MKDNNVKRCKWCGQEIAIITWGVYRKIVVDAEAVDVVPAEEGEDFIRIDGSKIRGREAEIGTIGTEPAYRVHRKTCSSRTE